MPLKGRRLEATQYILEELRQSVDGARQMKEMSEGKPDNVLYWAQTESVYADLVAYLEDRLIPSYGRSTDDV